MPSRLPSCSSRSVANPSPSLAQHLASLGLPSRPPQLLCHLVFSRDFTIAYLDVPETPGGTSLTLPTRVHANQYWAAVRETYDATHFPNGSLSLPLTPDDLQYSAPRPGPYPAWVRLANATGGTQLRKSWFVGLPTSSEARAGAMYAWGLLYSIPIVVFFLVDQLVSARLAQPAELRMPKGRYFHSGLLLLGVLNFILPLFGLPFVTGALPQSPELTIQMAETAAESEARLAEESGEPVDHKTGDTEAASAEESSLEPRPGLLARAFGRAKAADVDQRPSKAADVDRRPLVIESRLAPLLAYSLIFGSYMVPRMINLLPAAAVEGTLIYIGLTGIFNTQLWQRCMLMLSDWRLYSSSMPFTSVRPLTMHAYTCLQLGAIATAWLIQALPPALGLIFPLWILCLVPLRIWALPRLFTMDELHVLDPGSEALDRIGAVDATGGAAAAQSSAEQRADGEARPSGSAPAAAYGSFESSR